MRKTKAHYFTTGRGISEKNLKIMEEEIVKPYKAAVELKTMSDVKRFWENERNNKMKEKEASYENHHNFRSRLNVLWKSERLHMPEKLELPGSCLTDIDPTFFTIVSGRPIKEKKNIREYLRDIRNCFKTRLKTGYYLDEILLANERHINEKKRLGQVKKSFISCLKGFEEFLKEDHVSSSSLLEAAKEEEGKSKNKLEMINGLKEELKRLQAGVLVAEEKWRYLRMFQKFLYIISPSEWRKVHDSYYGREDTGKMIAADPCLFDNFREFPWDKKADLDVKILQFQEDVKQSQPPALYFSNPQDLLNILQDLEKNNLRALTHCKNLDSPTKKIMSDLEKTKIQFEEAQKNLVKEIKYVKELVEIEENNFKANQTQMKKTAFGLFRDLITSEEYLSVLSYVEDVYEDAVAPNDSNLDLVAMIKEIELKQESLLLALDTSPNDIVIQTTKQFYKEQKRKLKQAKEAEKKVHQMETLLKRLSKSLTYPKKGAKERKIVPRSLPPEEVMFKYIMPKIVSKEKRDYLFFFGETPANVRLHKPLCL